MTAYYPAFDVKTNISTDTHLKSIIDTKRFINNETDEGNIKRYFEILLRKIEHKVIYSENEVQNANILLISNEPGLTNSTILYPNFLEKIKNYSFECSCAEYNVAFIKEELETEFVHSMESWLKIKNHKNLSRPNGEKSEPKTNELMKTAGKAGFFFIDFNDLPQNQNIIVQDLFNFPQSNVNDYNELNLKNTITPYLKKVLQKTKINNVKSVA